MWLKSVQHDKKLSRWHPIWLSTRKWGDGKYRPFALSSRLDLSLNTIWVSTQVPVNHFMHTWTHPLPRLRSCARLVFRPMMSSQNLCKSSHSHFHFSWLQISHRCICGSLLLHSLSLNAPRRLEMLNVHIDFIDRLISPINDDYLCIVCCFNERNSKFTKFHFLGGELLASGSYVRISLPFLCGRTTY